MAGEAILSTTASIERTEAEHESDQALEHLVRQHSRMVYRIAYAVLRRHYDAEDATQETFLRVLRYNARLRFVEDPKTWLARIAWRVAVDRSTRRDRKHEHSLDDQPESVEEFACSKPLADDKVQALQLGAKLERLIAALPRKLREPLILSTIEEMTSHEIAATLQMNESAVRSRIFRARQILREKLTGQIGGKW